MTKKELSAYAGRKVYARVTRMGGKFANIESLTVYEITERGTLRYISEEINCIANKAQIACLENLTGGKYINGRPTAAKIPHDFFGGDGRVVSIIEHNGKR